MQAASAAGMARSTMALAVAPCRLDREAGADAAEPLLSGCNGCLYLDCAAKNLNAISSFLC